MWRAPLDYKFFVDKESMLAPELKKEESTETTEVDQEDCGDNGSGPAKVGHIKASGEKRSNPPLQYMPPAQEGMEGSRTQWKVAKMGAFCSTLARPSILMFNDFGSNFRYDLAQDARWYSWEEAVMDLVKTQKTGKV